MKKEWRGSLTVEMACLLPLIGMVFLCSVLMIFYYHDKNVLASCAYEAVIVGSTKTRERDGVTPETVEATFYERMGDKCILFGSAAAKASVGKTEVSLEVQAQQREMKVRISQTAKVTEPEAYIRTVRRLQSGLEPIGEEKDGDTGGTSGNGAD